MKMNMFHISRWASYAAALLMVAAPAALTSCKEDISEDAYAIKSMDTVSDMLAKRDDLSDIKALFEEVKLGKSANASSLLSVLSARGNYTVFAPNNDAVRAYVLEKTDGASQSIADLTYEQKELIAQNCIIDNGSQNAYELADFPSNGGTFATSNLKDRKLACTQDEADLLYVINGTSKVIENNLEASNGMMHVVNAVIAPSTNSVAELMGKAGNMRIMTKLLEITGYADSLKLRTQEEENYETENLNNDGSTKRIASFDFPFMEKRALGYTAFVEPDEVFHSDWGVPEPVYDEAQGVITNWDEIFKVIEEMCSTLICADTTSGDLTNPANPVNQFVAYHLLDGSLSTDEFVHHFNEYGYNYVNALEPATKGYSVNVWDYYTTLGYPRGLLKITQLPDRVDAEQSFYLNRVSVYDDGITGDYHEIRVKNDNAPGQNGLNIKVRPTNGDLDNNALNGFYYPIDNILVITPETRQALGSERMRIDVTTMLPELLSNDMRGRKVAYFPTGYFKGIMNESSGTQIYYLQDGHVQINGSWRDYQGDEFLFSGRYDFVLQLPPVPVAGTYELRMGISNNSLRGMVQIYFGDSPNTTTPVGLPIDQREGKDQIPGNPWVKDDKLDEDAIRENDRNLRNQGYMKGPNYITVTGSEGKTPVRNQDSSPALRRILTTVYMEPGQTYFMRFKSAIETDNTQFFVDYFEFVPYDIVTSTTPEDIW